MTGNSVLERMSEANVAREIKEDYARALEVMFYSMTPWKTFGTLTVRPDYGNRIESEQTGMSSDAMKKVLHKMFSKRKLRNIKYFWAIEKNLGAEFGGKGGTHAHFVTKDEPTDDAWKNRGWKRAWNWWHNIKGYGRFETRKVNSSKLQRLSVYLAKYAGKDAADVDWGFARFTRPEIKLVGERIPCVESVVENSAEYNELVRETMDWGRKAHAGARAVYRKPVLDENVKWSQIESSAH